MKYIKKLNELFDNEELKAQFEIPYLKGEIPLDGESMIGRSDRLLASLVNACPYLAELGFRKSGNILSIGFSDTKSFNDKDKLFYYFNIELVEYSDDRYTLNVYAKCIGNGHTVYDESLIKRSMGFIEVCSQINRPVLNILIDFNNWLEKTIDVSHFSIKTKDVSIVNPKMN